jgi:hypothetical protein
MAKSIEQKLKRADYGEIPEQVQQLEALFLELGLSVQLLADWNTMEINPESIGRLDKKPDDKLLQWQFTQLKLLLLSHDLQAETLFASIIPQLSEVVNSETVTAIQVDIASLNYEQAQQKIDLYITPALAELRQK